MARPRKEIDESQFRKLCQIQCTLTEIAAWFECSEDTIERWCKRELGQSFAEAHKIFGVDGKISLRRYQFKLAEKNVTMAIWLGKQYLGQKDTHEYNVSTITEAARKQVEAMLDDEAESDCADKEQPM